MKKGLLKDALIKIAFGIVAMGLLLFIPAGTIHWLEPRRLSPSKRMSSNTADLCSSQPS